MWLYWFRRHFLFGTSQLTFITLHTLFDQLLHFRFGIHTLLDQTIRIESTDTRVGLAARVHQRLRVTGLISFVMAQATETDEIQNHIFVELLAILQCNPQGPVGSLRI